MCGHHESQGVITTLAISYTYIHPFMISLLFFYLMQEKFLLKESILPPHYEYFMST